MADSQQGVRQQSARDAAGTTDTHSGDLRALFEAVATVPAGSTYNEAFILWLQEQTGSSEGNINDLAALYASQQDDTYNWSSTGSLGFPAFYDVNWEQAEALPSGFTFTRANTRWFRNGSGVWVSAGSNVIRLHNLTPGGGEQGYLPEPATTKLAVQRRDFTDAAWSATNITPAKDATGIDGVSNSCSTLTATAGLATIFQTITSASSSHTMQVFVARKTGTGTIEITIDGGTTYVDITSSLTSAIDNEFRITQTLANPSIGFRITTSGDEIEVDCCDVEATFFGTTPLVQDNVAAESVAQDDLTFATVDAGPWSYFSDHTYPNDLGSSSGEASTIVQISGAASRLEVYFGAFSTWNLFTFGGTSVNILIGATGDVSGIRGKISFRLADDDAAMTVTGQPITADTTTTGTLIGNLKPGQGNSKNFRGVIHRSIAYKVGLTDDQLLGSVA